jgi:trans-2,3-dihydro-3-hydroxyanthranilate isomerase
LREDGTGGHEMVVVLEEEVGPVRCGVFVKDGGLGHAMFDVPKLPQAVTATFDREAVASALGLVPGEIGFENHEISAFSAGVPFAFVPVRGLSAMARAKANLAFWASAFPEVTSAAYLYCRETEGSVHHFHARMFAPGMGIVEDPATGSAVAALPGALQRFDGFTAGAHRLIVEQGCEMERPSLITLEVDFEGGAITATRIGGDAVVVAEGTLNL